MSSAFPKRTAKNLCHEWADGKLAGTAKGATSPLTVNGRPPPFVVCLPSFSMWGRTAKRGERGGRFPPLPSASTPLPCGGRRQRGEREGQIPPFAVCLHPFAMRGQTTKRGERGGRFPPLPSASPPLPCGGRRQRGEPAPFLFVFCYIQHF